MPFQNAFNGTTEVAPFPEPIRGEVFQQHARKNDEGLAVEAADGDGGAARNADAGQENDEENGGGSDAGARQEI